MRKLVLVVGLVVVVFACSEPVGEMLVDSGQAMMDAGNGMVPDAGAQPGDAGCPDPVECPPAGQCRGLECVGGPVTDPFLVCDGFDTYVRYRRFANNTVACICNDQGGICGDADYYCGTTCRTDDFVVSL